jgi:hypothetical protein
LLERPDQNAHESNGPTAHPSLLATRKTTPRSRACHAIVRGGRSSRKGISGGSRAETRYPIPNEAAPFRSDRSTWQIKSARIRRARSQITSTCEQYHTAAATRGRRLAHGPGCP